jgi:ElaB/YqjD/DUF883 family membrane-anchored ribosome-binding protein
MVDAAVKPELSRSHSVFVEGRISASQGQVMAKRTNVRRAVSDVQDKSLGAVEGVREVRDNVADAIDRSLETRPYTTLLLAVGLGFVLGAIWAR